MFLSPGVCVLWTFLCSGFGIGDFYVGCGLMGVESGGWSRLMESKFTRVVVKERRWLVLQSLEAENIRTRCEI